MEADSGKKDVKRVKKYARYIPGRRMCLGVFLMSAQLALLLSPPLCERCLGLIRRPADGR